MSAGTHVLGCGLILQEFILQQLFSCILLAWSTTFSQKFFSIYKLACSGLLVQTSTPGKPGEANRTQPVLINYMPLAIFFSFNLFFLQSWLSLTDLQKPATFLFENDSYQKKVTTKNKINNATSLLLLNLAETPCLMFRHFWIVQEPRNRSYSSNTDALNSVVIFLVLL